MTCSCCGETLVEIKCPYTLRDQVPDPEKLKWLEKISDLFQLKKNSDHYYQIQCQLGVTGIKKAIYFVFTHHGHYIEEIEFDEV